MAKTFELLSSRGGGDLYISGQTTKNSLFLLSSLIQVILRKSEEIRRQPIFYENVRAYSNLLLPNNPAY